MILSLTVILCILFNCSSILSNSSEGSPCLSKEGLTGVCADIRTCVEYVRILKERNRPPVCSYKNEIPLVCCSDCELVNNTRNVLVNRYGLHYFKTGSKAHDKCLKYAIDQPYPCHLWEGYSRYLDDDDECYTYGRTSILAAESRRDPTTIDPHMALLGYGNDLKKARWLCAGTLISHRFVLTAASCGLSETGGFLNYIALGLVNPDYLWDKYNVRSVRPHHDYKPAASYYDIALIESEKWINFSSTVSPACLSTVETDETVAFATGWISNRHRRGISDSLVTVVLNKFSEPECNFMYSVNEDLINGYNHTSQMCYGNRKYVGDACQIDVGGALQVQSPISSCTHTVIGVMTQGTPCVSSGIYTRVSNFIPWIESNVWP